MLPSIWNENLWDEWFGFPELRDMDRAERKLYGRHADRLMKTDVREHEDQYEVDIDLPGFAKEEIKLELNNGYLTINAEKNLDQSVIPVRCSAASMWVKKSRRRMSRHRSSTAC